MKARNSAWLILALATASTSFAQGNPEKLGLTQVWSKSVGSGLGGNITGVYLHVSPKKSYQANNVVDRFGRRQFFSDIDLASNVSRAGYNQTERLTAMKVAELKARGLDPRVEQQSIADATLYVRSDLGMLTAMDAETGQIKWMTQAGKAGYPSFSVAATDEFVAAISSTKLFLIDAVTGQVLDSTSTRSIPSGTPSIDGDLIYVPTWRGIIEVYSTEDFGPIQFTMGSTSPVVGTVTICPEVISWASDAGQLYVGNRKRPGLRYRFQSPDSVASAPAYMEGNLFATSLDGFVYAIGEKDGLVKWRYSVGGSINSSPLAVDGMVFASSDEGQLVCIDAEAGTPRWMASNIMRFVSASENRLYCATKDHRLVSIDMATGNQLASQSIGRDDLPIMNITTDRLYLANKAGIVRCLRETGRRWPLTRQSVTYVDEVAEEASEEADDATTNASPSAGDDTPADDGFDDVEANDAEADDMDMEDAGDLFDLGDEDAGFSDETDDMGDDGDDPFGDF